eukprot:CAMPEP_0172453018 /NCGR_PEP_ID=MMETSP1065-20121228/10509_1 /TAXON_ID=265537 /ORGANISM="Amphiprora paludosa, Strain CCMP125" /LENGTH=384 /DNA_ID=CAMNT_0013205175 /DNA_START=207 /DNA_END=1358 /DNA_ORIENTATION=-
MTSMAAPADGIDFSELPWNLNLPEQHKYVHLTTTTTWSQEHLDTIEDHVHSYSERNLPATPAMTSLNYGTTLWEGLKCYRTNDNESVVFRADKNYERMKNGAQELCLPMPSKELFLRAIQVAIQSNSHLIPPPGEGMKLYVRPMLLGSGQQLGLYPSPEFSFLMYVSPTGNYFKNATSGLNLHLETKRARAARGGMGSTKCAGNYAAALKPLMDCKKHGFHDNIFLELDTYEVGQLGKAVIQEMSAANVFLVLKTGEIVTPSTDRGTILPGVTRASVLTIVETFADELTAILKEGWKEADVQGVSDSVQVKASSRAVLVSECENAVECFCTGTAAELVPIKRLATAPGEEEAEFNFVDNGPITKAILTMLREAMAGTRHVEDGW